ncbi:MAG: hypothetical protein CMN21_13615 [Rubinisphaera sp.]|nr:hypothetical protein [Rubinisphaera sp.]
MDSLINLAESLPSLFSDLLDFMNSLQHILQLMQEGRLLQAEALFNQLSESDAADPQALHLGGVIAMRLEQLGVALQRIDQAIVRDHRNAEFHNTRGAILMELERFPESFAAFSVALQINPGYLEANRNRGLPLLKAGQYEGAERAFREALEQFSSDLESWLFLAEAQLGQKNYVGTVNSIQQSLRLDPHCPKAHLVLIRTLISGEYFLAAEEALSKAQQICERHPEYIELRAVLLSKTEKFSEAIPLYQALIDNSSGSFNIKILLAAALLKTDRISEFHQLLEVIIKEQSQDSQLLNGLADILKKHQLLNEASAIYQSVLSVEPNHHLARIGLAEIDYERGKFPEAFNVIETLRKAGVRNLRLCLLEARLAIAQGHSDLAIRHLRHLVADDPNHVEGCRLLTEELLKVSVVVGAVAGMGSPRRLRLEEALLSCQRGLSHADNQELLYLQAKTLYALQRPQEAIVILSRLEQEATDARVVQLLGQCQLEMGTIEESRVSFQQALQRDPNSAPAHYHLAISGEMNHGEERIEDLQNRLQDDQLSARHKSLLWMALGRAHDANKHYEEAFDAYLQGNQLKPRPDFTNPEQQRLADHQHFVSEIAAVFDCDFYEQRIEMGHQSKLPVFIVGMPRSGTTLTEQILSSHTHVYGAGELQEVGAWPMQIERMIRTRPANYPDAARELDHHQIMQLASRHERFLAGHAPSALRIVDKMPTNFLHLGLIGLLFPNAKIIHCLRDPRDIAVSCLRQNLDWPFCDLEQLGPYITAYQNIMQHWKSTIPNANAINSAEATYHADLSALPPRPNDLLTTQAQNEAVIYGTQDATIRALEEVYRLAVQNARATYEGAIQDATALKVTATTQALVDYQIVVAQNESTAAAAQATSSGTAEDQQAAYEAAAQLAYMQAYATSYVTYQTAQTVADNNYEEAINTADNGYADDIAAAEAIRQAQLDTAWNIYSMATLESNLTYQTDYESTQQVFRTNSSLAQQTQRTNSFEASRDLAVNQATAQRDYQNGQRPDAATASTSTGYNTLLSQESDTYDQAVAGSRLAYQGSTIDSQQGYHTGLSQASRDDQARYLEAERLYDIAIADANLAFEQARIAAQTTRRGLIAAADADYAYEIAQADAAHISGERAANVAAWSSLSTDLGTPYAQFKLDEAQAQADTWDAISAQYIAQYNPAGTENFATANLTASSSRDQAWTTYALAQATINHQQEVDRLNLKAGFDLGITDAQHQQTTKLAEVQQQFQQVKYGIEGYSQAAYDYAGLTVETYEDEYGNPITYEPNRDTVYRNSVKQAWRDSDQAQSTARLDYVTNLSGIHQTAEADLAEVNRIYQQALADANRIASDARALVRTNFNKLEADTYAQETSTWTTSAPTPWHKQAALNAEAQAGATRRLLNFFSLVSKAGKSKCGGISPRNPMVAHKRNR